ncbi:MAG TPA: hypothetical protein PKE26_15090, partial [Kiritimatiellia bacterium]|nr:hypothetical protein [Kiritimatiellia bacterium]
MDSEPPAPATSASPVTPRQRLDAWTAASSWSLGVAASARGLDDQRSAPMFAAAAQAAAALDVGLPRWS